jgi:ribosomal protein L7Ae-like RNA K-turn-binding protein
MKSRRRIDTVEDSLKATKLLGMLGLALRAGKLAVGATAVKQMVARSHRPVLLVLASDGGEGLRERFKRLETVSLVVDDVVDRAGLAAALGRNDLAVVSVDDTGFVKGIRKIITGS